MYREVDENNVTRGSQEPKPIFPPDAMIQYSLIQCDFLGITAGNKNRLCCSELRIRIFRTMGVPLYF